MKDLYISLVEWLHISERLQDARHFVSDVVERNKGLLLIALAQLFSVCMNTMVKMLASLGRPVPTTQLIAFRLFITCGCSVGWMVRNNVPHPYLGPPEVRKWLVLRGVVGFFGLYGLYNGLHYLSLSDATVITFLSPSVIALLAWLFLKETFTRREAIAGLISFLGVILIARPVSLFGTSGGADDDGVAVERGVNDVTALQRLAAVAISLLGVVGGAGASVTIRFIGTRCHPMHTLVYFSFYGFVVGCVGAFVLKDTWTFPSVLWVGGMLLIGIFGFFNQYLTAVALRIETAGRASLGQYVQILFALLSEHLFFHAKPSILSGVGSVLILCSALYVAITKQGAAAPQSTAEYEPLEQDVEAGTSVELERTPPRTAPHTLVRPSIVVHAPSTESALPPGVLNKVENGHAEPTE